MYLIVWIPTNLAIYNKFSLEKVSIRGVIFILDAALSKFDAC